MSQDGNSDNGHKFPEDTKGLGSKVVRGSAWLFLARLVLRSLGFLNIVIIARILTPDDFGVIALATILIGFTQIFTQTGIVMALIKHKSPTDRHFDTAWTMRLIAACFATFIILLLAWPAADYFNDDRVINILLLMAFNPILESLSNIGVFHFNRNMDFNKSFKHQTSSRLIGFTATLSLALLLQTYWAIAIGSTVQALAFTGVSYYMHPYRPSFSLEKYREFLGFTIWSFMGIVAKTVSERVDRLFVGRVTTTGVTGLYTIASELPSMIDRELVPPIATTLLPAFARFGADKEKLHNALVVVFGFLVFISTAICTGLYLVSNEFILIVFGKQWIESIPFLQILIIATGMRILITGLAPYLLNAGNIRELSLIQFTKAVVICIVLYSVASEGPITIAWAVVVIEIPAFVALLVLVIYGLPSLLQPCLLVLLRMGGSGAAMFYAVTLIPAFDWLPITLLTLKVLVGASVYISVLLLLWAVLGRPKGIEQYALANIKAKLSGESAVG